jgi:hypothetical protein
MFKSKASGNKVTPSNADGGFALDCDAVRQMVEDMPINVMICDLKDFQITYANKATLESVKQLEHILDIKAGDLVGTCIDVFHKDPSHQRKLLSDPRNLPHQAQIEVGGEILDLLVTAVNDRNGNYIFPMVTWSIITQKVKADAKAEQLTQMVEGMPVGVMMCDTGNFEINYMNKFSTEALKGLQEHLPVKVDDMVGQCIDVFHKNPAHQRGILGDPSKLPHQAQIQVGPEILDLLVTPIHDKDGSYMGPMLTWSVVTAKVKADAQAAQLTQMVEGMPIGVMMCDTENFEINYMNKFSTEALKSLQEHLPVKVDDMVGQCIDVFHKNPAHQRGILGDASKLPHQAQIQVGPEVLDLLVTPIHDKDGSYMGPMLTWSVVTAKVKADAEAARLTQMVEQMPLGVMMCNTENFEVNYMNKFSTEALKGLQEYLPVKVDDMIGQCIDIFHKVPSHHPGRRLEAAAPGPDPGRTRGARPPGHPDPGQGRQLHGPDADLERRDRQGQGRRRGPASPADGRQHAYQRHDLRPRGVQAQLHQQHQPQDAAGDRAPAAGQGGRPDGPVHRHLPPEPLPSAQYPVRPEEPAAQGQHQAGRGDPVARGQRGDGQERRLPRPDGLLERDHRPDPHRHQRQRGGRHRGQRRQRAGEHLLFHVGHGGGDLQAGDQRGLGRRAGDQQRADRRLGHRGADQLDPGDQPPGPGGAQRCHPRRRRGQQDQRDGLIKDIAEQTNLLALNATIEAARAGEAGKGFAVVASEVKSLANQTAKATDDIASQIGSMQSTTTAAVQAIQEITKTIHTISETATAIAGAVEEQQAATQEIARNVQEASAGTQEVSSNIGGVEQAAGETGSSANQVLEASRELQTQGQKLRDEIEGFLKTLNVA